MSEQQPNKIRDFIGGIVLVLLLHTAFSILWFYLSYALLSGIPGLNKNYNFMFLLTPIVFLSITQLVYLFPTYRYFAGKGRSEVCKGILVGGLLTLMVNGACSGSIALGANATLPTLLIVGGALVIGTIGIVWVVRKHD
jgi:hypothetical protein